MNLRLNYIFFSLVTFMLSINIAWPQSALENQARVKYFAALEAFDDKEYELALSYISDVEFLLGSNNARLSSLRVKALYYKGDLGGAKKELSVFFRLKSSDIQLKEMATYLKKVDGEIASLKEKRRKELLARKKEKEEEKMQEQLKAVRQSKIERLAKSSFIKVKSSFENFHTTYSLPEESCSGLKETPSGWQRINCNGIFESNRYSDYDIRKRNSFCNFEVSYTRSKLICSSADTHPRNCKINSKREFVQHYDFINEDFTGYEIDRARGGSTGFYRNKKNKKTIGPYMAENLSYNNFDEFKKSYLKLRDDVRHLATICLSIK